MNVWRKLIVLSLLSSGLLLLGAAAPASAKTFYGDLYMGFNLNVEGMPVMAQGMDFGSMMSQMTLPFRGKVYYQDGMIRLDADVPSMQELMDAKGAKKAKDVQAYQVYSILIDEKGCEYMLLNHGLRQAYRLRLPEEMGGMTPYADPYALLTSKEFIQGLTQDGNIKYLHTRRLRQRTIEGLKTAGVETTLRIKLPPTDLQQLQQLGVDFNGIFTLRLYYELESKFPILYELNSELFTITFQLINVRKDRLPDVLFEIPAFYTVKDFTAEDVEQMLLDLAQEATNLGSRLAAAEETAAPEPVAPAEEAPAPETGGKPAEGGETAPPPEGGEAPPQEPPPGGGEAPPPEPPTEGEAG